MIEMTEMGIDEAVAVQEAEATEAPAKKAKKAKAVKVVTGPVCVICGKPLRDPKSIEKGMGDVCEHGGSIEDRKARVEAHSAETAPEGWMKIGDVVKALAANKKDWNIPPMRIVRPLVATISKPRLLILSSSQCTSKVHAIWIPLWSVQKGARSCWQ